MNQLKIIERKDRRVLTTNQLAESYETDAQVIVNNFNRNKDRYTEGKHFILLQGVELKSFIAKNQFDLSPNVNKLYLWTEKGAWHHAKSLNTDKAWEAYEVLVDEYYKKKESGIDVSLLTPEMQMFKHMFDGVAKMQIEQSQTQKELTEVKQTVETIQETFLKRDKDWRKSIDSLIKGAAFRMGGNYQELRNKSYQSLEERGRCDLNRRLRGLKERLSDKGATKSKIDGANRVDVIENDPKLKEIYTTIVKELSISSLKVAR